MILTCLLKPADKLATVSLLLALTSSFFGRIIPFENSVNKNGQLNTVHIMLRHNLFIIHISHMKCSLKYKLGTIRCLYHMLKDKQFYGYEKNINPFMSSLATFQHVNFNPIYHLTNLLSHYIHVPSLISLLLAPSDISSISSRSEQETAGVLIFPYQTIFLYIFAQINSKSASERLEIKRTQKG
jgi:hypothetical protein